MDWTNDELTAGTRAYLWMRRSVLEGYTPIYKRVFEALLAGPLLHRNDKSLEYLFQNISAAMREMGKSLLEIYQPQENISSFTLEKIQTIIELYMKNGRNYRLISSLISNLPTSTIQEAAQRLAKGEEFDYPDSTDYVVAVDANTLLAPKRVIGLAGLIYYGAPLLSDDFKGASTSIAFRRIRATGLLIGMKAEPDSEKFRKVVLARKEDGFKSPPTGNKNPVRFTSSSLSFLRDPDVVAFAEERAKGICDHCRKSAPFQRSDKSPYLEVHHIVFLSNGGPDTPENVAALCPDCHRECHHGELASNIKDKLLNLRSSD